jgi:putative transposase
MSLSATPKRYRYPLSVINQAVWLYNRFNLSLRDVEEQLLFRGICVSYETIRAWCIKFSHHFSEVIKKRQRKATDKWHIDEMVVRVNGEKYILWRAVDSEGLEAAIRILTKLLNTHPTPRVIVTDKLKSYQKPIKSMFPNTHHRTNKRLNNRVENAHQPTRRREKTLVRFKSPQGAQRLANLMGKVRNIFAVQVGRYRESATTRRNSLCAAMAIWLEAAQSLLCA